MALRQCCWGRRRGRRLLQGRRDDAYPVADRSVIFNLYLYIYLYSAAVVDRGDVVLLPILLFLAWGLFGRSLVDFNREDRTRMTMRGPNPPFPQSPSPASLPSWAVVIKTSFATPPIIFLFSLMMMTGRLWLSSKSTFNLNLLC